MSDGEVFSEFGATRLRGADRLDRLRVGLRARNVLARLDESAKRADEQDSVARDADVGQEPVRVMDS
jgi:hypothetical protein